MNNSRQLFSDLIDLLTEETEIYDRLSVLLDREKEALLKWDVSALGELASAKETLGLRIRTLDESRRILAERLGRDLGLPREDLTVTRLSEFVPPDLRDRLLSARDLLRERAVACKTINEYNARAAQQGIRTISSAVEFLVAEATHNDQVYQKKGGYRRAAPGHGRPAVISRQV